MKYENKIYAIKELFETPFEIKKRELMLYRTLTGYNLAEEVAATNPKLVLDLGCGANSFKSLIPNVVGTDVSAVGNVDVVTDIRSLTDIFSPSCADWIFCFGPLNFGEEDWIDEICSVFKYLLHPKGTIVAAAKKGKFSIWSEKNAIRPYNLFGAKNISWSNEFINSLALKHGFVPTEHKQGYTDNLDVSSMTDEHLQLFKTLMKERGKTEIEIEDLILNKQFFEQDRAIWRWKHK